MSWPVTEGPSSATAGEVKPAIGHPDHQSDKGLGTGPGIFFQAEDTAFLSANFSETPIPLGRVSTDSWLRGRGRSLLVPWEAPLAQGTYRGSQIPIPRLKMTMAT